MALGVPGEFGTPAGGLRPEGTVSWAEPTSTGLAGASISNTCSRPTLWSVPLTARPRLPVIGRPMRSKKSAPANTPTPATPPVIGISCRRIGCSGRVISITLSPVLPPTRATFPDTATSRAPSTSVRLKLLGADLQGAGDQAERLAQIDGPRSGGLARRRALHLAAGGIHETEGEGLAGDDGEVERCIRLGRLEDERRAAKRDRRDRAGIAAGDKG